MIEFVCIAIIIAVLVIANWLFRRWLGRYSGYIVACVVAVIANLALGDVIYLATRDANYSSFIRSLLPMQFVILIAGLIWLRVNAFKMTMPKGAPPPPRARGRVEPTFGAAERVPAVHDAQRLTDAIYDDPPLDEVRGNFLAHYWRGQFSLPFSFWVVGILATVATVFVTIALDALLGTSEGYNPYNIFAFILSTWLFLVVLTIWKTVGLWRSASRYMRERWQRGTHTFWGGLVKVLVVLSVPASIADVGRSGLPQIKEAFNIAFLGDPDLPDYTLRVMRNGTEIEIVGGFKYGLAADLERVIKASPQIAVVHLDSIGGRIGEAIKVHDIVRQKRLITYVAAHCYSACTLAFAGGRERWLGSAGKLGFHAPDFPGTSPAELSSAVLQQQVLLEGNGFERSFVTRALSTPATSLWVPTTQELFAGRAVTELAPPGRFAISGFGANLDLAKAAVNVKIISPAIAAIEERDAATAQAIYQRFLQMYLAGNTVADVAAVLQSALATEFLKYRSQADDQTTIAFAQLAIEQIEQIARLDTQVCYEHLSGVGNANINNYLTPELIKREAELVAAMIRAAAPRRSVDKTVVDAGMENVMVTLRAGPQRKNIVLYSRVPTPKEYGDACALIAATYRAALKQPPATAAALMRRLMFDDAE